MTQTIIRRTRRHLATSASKLAQFARHSARAGAFSTLLLAGTILPQAALADARLPHMFRSFQSAGGNFTLGASTRIVVQSNDTALVGNLTDARGWVQKLRYATGLDLEIVVGGEARAGDIVLTSQANQALGDAASGTSFSWADQTKDISADVRREGYSYDATSQGLTISFHESQGALRGLQNLGQLLLGDGRAAGQHRDVPIGTGIDFPTFGLRGVMVDVGRQFVPVDQLLGLMDEMSAPKLNTLHLHLSDNVCERTGRAQRLPAALGSNGQGGAARERRTPLRVGGAAKVLAARRDEPARR